MQRVAPWALITVHVTVNYVDTRRGRGDFKEGLILRKIALEFKGLRNRVKYTTVSNTYCSGKSRTT